MYEYAENRFVISINGNLYDLSNSELNIIDSANNAPLHFCFKCEGYSIEYVLMLGMREVDGEEVAFHQVNKLSIEEPIISYGNTTRHLTDFLQEFTPTI